MTRERNERFKKICQLAREMWESEGRPADRHDVLWLKAMAEIDAASPDQPGFQAEISLLSRAVTAMDDIVTQAVEHVPSEAVKMHSSRL